MKIAIYPGSFSPWHEGHTEVLDKALQIFDKVIVAQGINGEKSPINRTEIPEYIKLKKGVECTSFLGLFADFVESYPEKINAVIKGLRNTNDLEYEKSMQYWNEDLGLTIPVFYVVSSRNLTHISSSAIRSIKGLK